MRISTVGSSDAQPRSHLIRVHGFTLIELLVTLGIMSLALLLAIPAVGPLVERPAPPASSLRQLMDAIAHSRDAAMAAGKPVYAAFDFTRQMWSDTAAGVVYTLPPDEAVYESYQALQTQSKQHPVRYCEFLPDGRGCRITLWQVHDTETFQIEVDEVSGRIVMSRVDG